MLIRDKFSARRHRVFGFIVFSDPLILDTVLKDNHTIDGRTFLVDVVRVRPRIELEQSDRAGKLSPAQQAHGLGSSNSTAAAMLVPKLHFNHVQEQSNL
ncbi:Uncharacterized protein TCM_020966 [Theobroma cacao]|uniref:RRM domain-containing protein n=1 Tax=Theobroma cacao TaxID=3641 RepID=A0A061EMV5_THECC|nr:Uncharacterized protein TCM_020966 [Theobroma cacao]